MGTFPCAHIDLRKARERELAAFHEKSTSNGIAETLSMRDKNLKERTGGKEGTTPVTTACPQTKKK